MTRAAEWLARLIEHRTDNPGGDEVALCRTLSRAFTELGCDATDVWEVPRNDGTGAVGAYCLARWGRPRLLLNAHIDTVPANRSWSRDPFTAHDDGEFIYGLGAADTKGAAAAMLAALERERPRNVAFLFSGDEERGQTCMNHFLASEMVGEIERAIVSEPTARRAVVRHRGVASFRAEVACAGGHSSRADHRPKPMVARARLAVELDAVARRWVTRGPSDMPGLCMNIAGIDGGVAFNVIPERAAMTYSFRPPPGCPRDEVDADILQAIASAALEEGPPVRIVQVMDRAPFATRDLEAFRPGLGGAIDGAGPIDVWTEGAERARAGIDAVVIGPGEVGQAHASDERVSRADLDWAEDLYAGVFARSREA